MFFCSKKGEKRSIHVQDLGQDLFLYPLVSFLHHGEGRKRLHLERQTSNHT